MNDDLIARLRRTANLTPFARLLIDAADQFEALQLENHQQRALIRSSGQEINRLRDQLSESS